MGKTLDRFIVATLFFILVFGSIANGQTDETMRAQLAVKKVLEDAGTAFNEGLLAFADKDRRSAGEKFNKSVEVFLYSTIQRDQRLQLCYNQLIETIYLIEFPTDRNTPQIKNLALTCGWNVDTSLSERVASITRATPKSPVPSSTTLASTLVPTPVSNGFTSQEHRAVTARRSDKARTEHR